MDLYEFTALAREYNSLGWAVTEQLSEVLDDSDRVDECNPSALKLMVPLIEKLAARGVEGTEWVLEAIRERV